MNSILNPQFLSRHVRAICRQALVVGTLVLASSLGHAAQPAGATVPTAAHGDTAYQVEIRNFAFSPKTLTVPVGTRVVWTNRDDEPHVVVSSGAAFKASPALDTDDSFAVVLSKPGTYAYFCGIHPMMVGTIIVH